MAFLTSIAGKFYDVPDDKLSQYLVSEELVQNIVAALDASRTAAPPPSEWFGPSDDMLDECCDCGPGDEPDECWEAPDCGW